MTDSTAVACLIPYVYQRPVERSRAPSRIETEAFDDLRDLVAFLQSHGAPASLEQELTVAVRAHVAGMAARFGLTSFPERDGDLTKGRRAGVWKRPPEPAEGEDAALDMAPDDESGDGEPLPEVAPGVPMSEGTRRKVQRLARQEGDETIAELLELPIEAVRVVTKRPEKRARKRAG